MNLNYQTKSSLEKSWRQCRRSLYAVARWGLFISVPAVLAACSLLPIGGQRPGGDLGCRNGRGGGTDGDHCRSRQPDFTTDFHYGTDGSHIGYGHTASTPSTNPDTDSFYPGFPDPGTDIPIHLLLQPAGAQPEQLGDIMDRHIPAVRRQLH